MGDRLVFARHGTGSPRTKILLATAAVGLVGALVVAWRCARLFEDALHAPPTRADLRDHAVRFTSFWQSFAGKPLTERVFASPLELENFLNIDNRADGFDASTRDRALCRYRQIWAPTRAQRLRTCRRRSLSV